MKFVPNSSQELFGLLPCDTQEIEGANSIIKRVHHLAPNVKLPLMSARIVIKKALGGEILKGGKQARLDAVHHAVENHKAALEQLQLIAVHGPHGRFPSVQTNAPEVEPLPLVDGNLDSAGNLQPSVIPPVPQNHSTDHRDDVDNSAHKPKQQRKPRSLNAGAPDRCISRMVAMLQASAGNQNLQAEAAVCFTFQVSLGSCIEKLSV